MKNQLFALLLMFLFGNVQIEAKCKCHLDQIVEEDRIILETFFRDLLFSNGFAFTLFGDKPISINEYDIDKSKLFSNSSVGYETWNKYSSLLPNSNYLFVFHENKISCLFEITLINKSAVQKVVIQNKDKFLDFFGPEVSSDKLISLIIDNGSLWNTPLKDRDDLIGILLGYGRKNAELFQKRSELGLRKAGIKKSRTKPSPGYRSVKEELKAITRTLRPFDQSERSALFLMRLPGFVADSYSDETIDLKRKYTEQRKQITEVFSKGRVLEIVLEQLCSSKE